MTRHMKSHTFLFKTRLWLYPGDNGSWHFLTIPKKESAKIKETYAAFTKGWGSLPVTVTIGKTSWETSIFPDRKSGTYLLPVKAIVRRAEGIGENDLISYTFTIRT